MSTSELSVRMSVAAAAGVIGVAQNTVYGLVRRGEITASKDASGQLWLDAGDVAAASARPHHRGHPRVNPPGDCRRVQTARASDAEVTAWAQAAKRQGVGIGPWLRKLANDNS